MTPKTCPQCHSQDFIKEQGDDSFGYQMRCLNCGYIAPLSFKNSPARKSFYQSNKNHYGKHYTN